MDTPRAARRRRPPAGGKALRWALIAGLCAFVMLADWFADGLGPRLVLGSATLGLTSTPDGAEVRVDGVRVGVTPLDHAVRPGDVVVRVAHRFAEPVVQRLHLERDELRALHVDLPAASGSLTIVSNPRGASLAIDQRPLEETAPATLDPYPAGAYEVTAAIDGWRSIARTVEVLPNKATEVAFELQRLPVGEVFLDLSPSDAQVHIVDLDTPYHRGMRLQRGIYKFHAKRDGYVGETFQLRVLRGRNQHTVRLARRQARLTITATPADATVDVAYLDGSDWRDIRYAAPVSLPAGEVVVTARAVGYRNYRRRLTVRGGPQTHAFRMQAFDVEPGRRFRDALASGGEGPQMVVIPAGAFRMGSADGPADERPVHEVVVTQPFAIGVFEVTHAEFDRFRGDPPVLRQPRRGEPALPVPAEDVADHPVTDIAWDEAVAYATWLGEQTGYRYRLPSEAEWEYAARAGHGARYPFGGDVAELCRHANIADETLAARYRKHRTADCNDGVLGLAPVGGLLANPFGIHDMLGNAEEWVADCWRRNYANAGGRRRGGGTRRPDTGSCAAHAVRGGAWDSAPEEATVSYRSFSSGAGSSRGFRVVREL